MKSAMQELTYYRGTQRFTVTNPTLKDLHRAIEALDNAERSFVKLDAKRGYMHVVGGNQGRVNVAYCDHTLNIIEFQAGVLLDTSYSDDDGEISIRVQDETQPVALRRTVTKDTALRVAEHFFEYENFPSDLEWQGWMENMSKS